MRPSSAKSRKGNLRELKQYRHADTPWMAMAQRLTSKGSCLLWKGAVDKDGYGQVHAMNVSRGLGVTRAHQLSYVMAYGVIPEGMVIRHMCDNPTCVNPAHLEIGTVADNNRDSYVPSRTKRKPYKLKRKITKEDYLKIMELKGKRSSLLVGPEFGISYSTVCSLWRGENDLSFTT